MRAVGIKTLTVVLYCTDNESRVFFVLKRLRVLTAILRSSVHSVCSWHMMAITRMSAQAHADKVLHHSWTYSCQCRETLLNSDPIYFYLWGWSMCLVDGVQPS